GANASVTIDGNDNSITGNAIGIDVNAGSATINNNHIYDNTVGIRLINGGTASVTSNNFVGGPDNGTDLQLDSTAGSLTTLTGNAFAGNTFFIDNQSTQNLNVTAGTGNTFDESNNYRIEDKMFHRVDNLATGLVTWVANNVWITQPGGGSTDSSIQRGVNALPGGHVVNVEGGANPYLEAVTIDRAVTIDGEGSGPTPSATMRPPSAGANTIPVTTTTPTDDVTIQDIAFDGLANTGVAGV